jgi:uncharacterized protein YpuA (DUF1002 family)
VNKKIKRSVVFMKKLIKKITMVGLIGLMVLGNAVTINAKVIQGTKGRTYITLDSIEKRENKEVLKYLGITSYNLKMNKKEYVVRFRSNLNSSKTKKIVKQVVNKLHGTRIEKDLKEYRTYKIVVKGIDNKGKTHTYSIKGHKVK